MVLATACSNSVPEQVKKEILFRENARRRLVLDMNFTRYQNTGSISTYWYNAVIQDSMMNIIQRMDSINIKERTPGIFDPISKLEEN